MMNKKLIRSLLILLFALLFIGCSGVQKTADLDLSFDPNPAPYEFGTDSWPFTITVTEQNGVGVTLTELTFKTYNNNNQLLSTDVFDSNDIADSFGTNYLSAFSFLDNDLSRANNINGIKYAIISVDGVDDNNVPVTAEARIDFLPFL
jgi:hypothetical protein